MGEKDKETRKYMGDSAHFADAFNYYIYHGEEVIKPENLSELDTAELAIPFGGDGNSSEGISKYRDVLKSATIKYDEKATYVLLGIENQANVHYAMPVRNMLYDAISYTKQVDEKAKEHRKNEDLQSGGEFLSGFSKLDKINPVITLVILWSSGKWDGPLSIHDMLSTDDSRILSLVSDYKINIISPYDMPDNDFGFFSTELGEALHFVKYAGNKEELEKLVRNIPDFRHLDSETVRLINEVSNAKIRINEGEKVVDVCQAILDMKQDSFDNGINQGTDNARVDAIHKMMLKLNYSPAQAMDILDIPKESRDRYLKML